MKTIVNTVVTAALLLAGVSAKAQIMGYESPVQMPQMGIFGGFAQQQYLNSLQSMAELGRQLSAIIPSYHKAAKAEYDKRNYDGCISIIDNFLDNQTIYKILLSYYSPLFYLRGCAYISKDPYNDYNIANAIYDFKSANEGGNAQAQNYLNDIFGYLAKRAVSELQDKNYSKCINTIEMAYSTDVSDPTLWLVKGDAFVGLHDFKQGKACYKTARKAGLNQQAQAKLNELKIVVKEFNSKKAD